MVGGGGEQWDDTYYNIYYTLILVCGEKDTVVATLITAAAITLLRLSPGANIYKW